MANSPNYMANGNILPSVFVQIDTAGTGQTANPAYSKVIAAASGSQPVGVSQAGTKYTPVTGVTDVNAAEAGDMVQVFGEGESQVLLLLTGSVAAGQLLKPDATGNGTAIAVNMSGGGAQLLRRPR